MTAARISVPALPDPRFPGPPSAVEKINVKGLERELRRHVDGEVRFEAGSLAMYANDSSNFRQVPTGVVVPRTYDDVVATMRACHRHRAPVLPRGGGTSLSGETVNNALVIDVSKYLTEVGEIHAGRRRVTAQPGVINEQLKRRPGGTAWCSVPTRASAGPSPRHPARAGAPQGRRDPQRGLEGGHADRPGRRRSPGRGRAGRRAARGGGAKTLLGREVLPDDLPFVTGPIGLLGSTASYDLMMNADTLFLVGTGFPYAEWLPEEGQCKAVEIDIDGRMIGVRYPVQANLVDDAKETLRALMPMLDRKPDRSWREQVEKEVAQWWRAVDDRAHDPGDPMNPQWVAHELSKRLPDDVILTVDSGSGTNWWARQLRLRKMRASLSGTLATMGPGTPYAIGAKFAFPERPVIAMVGDGAFQMNGMNGMSRALAADGPCVLEVVVDPEIPPIPPHIKKMLGKHSVKAMLKGDPELAGVVGKGAMQKMHEFTESMKELARR